MAQNVLEDAEPHRQMVKSFVQGSDLSGKEKPISAVSIIASIMPFVFPK
jgi:hypothetical protein